MDEDHLARLDAMLGNHGLQCLEQLVDGGIAIGMDLDWPALCVRLVEIRLDLLGVGMAG